MSALHPTESHEEEMENAPQAGAGEQAARKQADTRRVLACGTCRKRKLKCDSKRPKCSTCARLGHTCQYDEVRKKSGPKRGYVKELEARLKQVETLLTSQVDSTAAPTATAGATNGQANNLTGFNEPLPNVSAQVPDAENGFNFNNDFSVDAMGGIEDFSWDMISLGLEEPLPPQDIMDELYQVFFEKVHPSLPMVHRPRFMASLNMSVNQRPPVCLRYIMWAHACGVMPQYKPSAEQFYLKARKYMEQDEMKGHGESFISIHHAQAWVLIGTYEFKSMYFPRAWMSAGRASRLCQLMGLHRQDRVGLDVKQTMAPPKDWIEREERRRTFWMTYCQDRYASIGTGWPMTIDERDILTNLPATDEAFLTGRAEATPALQDVVTGDGTVSLSSFAAVCLLATLFGRNLTHLHRPDQEDNDHDLNGEFWKRHRTLDNILLNTSLSLPGHLRLPFGLSDPNVVFANMSIHTSTICLHQAAIFKADKHRLPVQISAESKRRCIVAADQITNIMKMCSHLDLALFNPFIAFCLYVSARVFVQYLKSKKTDTTVRASLTFLLSAMTALRHKNPLTESFLVQLDVDLEGSGLNIPSPLGGAAGRYTTRVPAEVPANTDALRCAGLAEIRETQTIGQKSRYTVGGEEIDLDTNVDFSGLGYNPLSHKHNPNARSGPPNHPQRPDFTNPTSNGPSVSGSNSSNTQTPGNITGDQSWLYANDSASPSNAFNTSTAFSRPSPVSISSASNQNTPSGSSAHNGSSNTESSNAGFSPPLSKDSSMPWLNGSRHNSVNNVQNMNQQTSIQNPNGSGNSQGFFDNVPTSVAPNMNDNSNLQNNSNQNGFGNIFSGTSFASTQNNPLSPPSFLNQETSTGLTPGPLGAGTGMTPSGWSDLNIPDNNDWMYGN